MHWICCLCVIGAIAFGFLLCKMLDERRERNHIVPGLWDVCDGCGRTAMNSTQPELDQWRHIKPKKKGMASFWVCSNCKPDFENLTRYEE